MIPRRVAVRHEDRAAAFGSMRLPRSGVRFSIREKIIPPSSLPAAMPKQSVLVSSAVALVLLLAEVGADDKKTAPKLPPAAEGKIDFDADIKPILAAHCVSYHGPLKQKGGLQLDNGTSAKGRFR